MSRTVIKTALDMRYNYLSWFGSQVTSINCNLTER